MKQLSFISVFAALILSAGGSSALARGGTREIHFGSLGAGSLVSEKAAGSTMTTIGARGDYLVQMKEELQVGGEAMFESVSGGGAKSTSRIDLAGVGAWNFDRNLAGSIYAKGGVGLFSVLNDKGDYENKFGFFVGGGKRFPLWSNVAYAPEVRLYKKGELDPSFEIIFLNISILF